MSKPERDAQHEHAERRTTQVLLEALKKERALKLFADAARENRNHAEHRGVLRSAGGEPLDADWPPRCEGRAAREAARS